MLSGCQQDLMCPIQPAENAALLTFGCCQPINEGIFCSASTTVARCMKSLNLLHEVIQESFEWWGEGLHFVYVHVVQRIETVCLFMAGVNCLSGRYSMSDLLRGSIGSIHSIRIYSFNASLKACVCHPITGRH